MGVFSKRAQVHGVKVGARGFVVGWGTVAQAGRSRSHTSKQGGSRGEACILDTVGLNFDLDSGCPKNSRGLSQFLQANSGLAPAIQLQGFPSTIFSVQCLFSSNP
jgi:hypothetical protein